MAISLGSSALREQDSRLARSTSPTPWGNGYPKGLQSPFISGSKSGAGCPIASECGPRMGQHEYVVQHRGHGGCSCRLNRDPPPARLASPAILPPCLEVGERAMAASRALPFSRQATGERPMSDPFVRNPCRYPTDRPGDARRGDGGEGADAPVEPCAASG